LAAILLFWRLDKSLNILFLCVEVGSQDSLHGSQFPFYIMHCPPELLSRFPASQEFSKPYGNDAAYRSDKRPSEQSN